MATPTLTNLFGTGAIVAMDETDLPIPTAQSPVLCIPFTALNAGLLNQVASLQNPEKIVVALANMWSAWYQSDNTEDPIIEATAIRESTITRRNQRMRSYSYEFTAHQPLPATPAIDPDVIDQQPA